MLITDLVVDLHQRLEIKPNIEIEYSSEQPDCLSILHIEIQKFNNVAILDQSKTFFVLTHMSIHIA